MSYVFIVLAVAYAFAELIGQMDKAIQRDIQRDLDLDGERR